MIRATAEVNVEKQSFPNLDMKIPFKDRSHDFFFFKGDLIIEKKKGIWFF